MIDSDTVKHPSARERSAAVLQASRSACASGRLWEKSETPRHFNVLRLVFDTAALRGGVGVHPERLQDISRGVIISWKILRAGRSRILKTIPGAEALSVIQIDEPNDGPRDEPPPSPPSA